MANGKKKDNSHRTEIRTVAPSKPWGSHNGMGGRVFDEDHCRRIDEIYARSQLESARRRSSSQLR